MDERVALNGPGPVGSRPAADAVEPMAAQARIAGIGVAVPAGYEQQALWDGFFREYFAAGEGPEPRLEDAPGGDRRTVSARAFARRVFQQAGVRRRHTVVDLLREETPHGWTTAERMRRYREEAPPLAHRAVLAALTDAGMPAEDIGLLTVTSCTGYDTPGLDVRIAASLGLRADTQRLLVGHMGCYAALPALGTAADFVAARGKPAVLLSLELSSLHLQPPTLDPQQVVTHALFGDAAVAMVLRPPSSHRVADTDAGCHGPGLGARLVEVAAHTDAATRDQMTWRITDHGFRMGLSPQVPEVLAKHVGPVVTELLARHGLELKQVGGWAVHPGGPRILDTVEEQLALPAAALTDSRAVLADYGNCSSPTVLLVMERLLRSGKLTTGAPIVILAFGPGLTLYAALLRAD